VLLSGGAEGRELEFHATLLSTMTRIQHFSLNTVAVAVELQ
jgi:hypothetical protein